MGKRRVHDRSGERVCWCGAYHFPHRMFGGSCDPEYWVVRFFSPSRHECSGCISRDGPDCEVVNGSEQPFHCPELRDMIRYEGIKLYGRASRLFDRSQRKAA